MANGFSIKTSKKKNLVFIQIQGNLTLKNSEKIKKELYKIIIDNSGLKFEIKIDSLQDIDLSFLQLLLSWNKQNEIASISMNLTEELKPLVTSSGIIDLLKIKIN